MTRKEEQLLIRDLCARSPYGVKCKIRYTFNNETTFGEDVKAEEYDVLVKIDPQTQSAYFDWYGDFISIENFKPYLRPMSSMTEEEFELLKQYSGLKYDQLDLAEFPNNHKCLDFYLSEVPSYTVILVFDWLNAHHFDYRLLIEMGLALEAPEGMYETE